MYPAQLDIVLGFVRRIPTFLFCVGVHWDIFARTSREGLSGAGCRGWQIMKYAVGALFLLVIVIFILQGFPITTVW
jgi:hypothetical protein